MEFLLAGKHEVLFPVRASQKPAWQAFFLKKNGHVHNTSASGSSSGLLARWGCFRMGRLVWTPKQNHDFESRLSGSGSNKISAKICGRFLQRNPQYVGTPKGPKRSDFPAQLVTAPPCIRWSSANGWWQSGPPGVKVEDFLLLEDLTFALWGKTWMDKYNIDISYVRTTWAATCGGSPPMVSGGASVNIE